MTSSPDPFQYFGLDRDTCTERDLKRAYAGKLKTVRPEDDREGFMILRQCFESAKRQIVWRNEDAAYEAEEAAMDQLDQHPDASLETAALLVQEHLNPIIHDQWHDAPQPDATPTPPKVEPRPRLQAETHPVDTAMEDIATLITSPFAGGSFAPWQAILEREDLQTIDHYQIFSDRLRSYICEKTGLYDEVGDEDDAPIMRFPSWLSVPVLKGLGDTFGWHKQHSRQYWIRGENDWIANLGIEYAKPGDPTERQRARKRVTDPDQKTRKNDPYSSGGHIHKDSPDNQIVRWGWIALRIIILLIILRTFLN